MKILLIEDNEPMAFLVCTLLKAHDYEVEHYALGKPGWSAFTRPIPPGMR